MICLFSPVFYANIIFMQKDTSWETPLHPLLNFRKLQFREGVRCKVASLRGLKVIFVYQNIDNSHVSPYNLMTWNLKTLNHNETEAKVELYIFFYEIE